MTNYHGGRVAMPHSVDAQRILNQIARLGRQAVENLPNMTMWTSRDLLLIELENLDFIPRRDGFIRAEGAGPITEKGRRVLGVWNTLYPPV